MKQSNQQIKKFLPLHNQDVSESQMIITNRLIQFVSDNNIDYFNKREFPCLHQQKQIVTIAINGIPYNKAEFEGFIFPGTFVNYIIPGLEPSGSKQFYQERLKKIKKQYIVAEMDEIVQKYGKGKVILVYHSFGTYAATLYAINFPSKVIGLVQFGAMPIYPSIQDRNFYNNKKYMNKNKELDIDQQWNIYLQQLKKHPFRIPLHNKYNNLAEKLLLAEILENIFHLRREMPKVLTFYALGRNDRVIQTKDINSTIAYYTYKNDLNEQYQRKLNQVYKNLTNDNIKKIQQRFILSFPKTGHGVHLKKKKQIQNALNLYFSLILWQLPIRSNI